MKSTIYNMDCRDAMSLFIDANSVDSIVTDPPYGLGFMGKEWDHGVPGVEFWQQAYEVLKPGGHLLAFSGSRTYHRMVCAIEDAGFEIRDQIMWVYGSGFPKSLDVSKAIDKAAGVEREVLRPNPHARPSDGQTFACMSAKGHDPYITAPATHAAQQWQGWGTALKPAHEPICVARKPLIGTVAANVLHWGTGGLNIDACRVDAQGESLTGGGDFGNMNSGEAFDRPWKHDPQKVAEHGEKRKANALVSQALGRWPANLIHDGSDEVLAAFPETGPSKQGVRDPNGSMGYHGGASGLPGVLSGHNDKGSAARFFYCAKASKKDRNDGLDGHETVIIEWSLTAESPKWDNADQRVVLQVDTEPSRRRVIGVSGASNKSASEWGMLLFGNEHTAPCLQASTCIIETLSNLTTDLTTLSYFQNLLTSANTQVANCEMVSGGSLAQTAAPGTLLLRTTGESMASALGVAPAVSPTLLKISASARRSDHPTVKPTDLMAYLCRLVTPPGGTVLDPFTGSGSTGKAAVREGFNFIGCELDADYVAIAEARIAAELAKAAA